MDLIELAKTCKKAAEAGLCDAVIAACDMVLGPSFSFKARVEGWSFVVAGRPGEPPSTWMPRIMGIVEGHPLQGNGKKFLSEAICSIDPDKKVVTTSLGVYTLGEVDEDFRTKVFKDADEKKMLAYYADILKGVA